MTRDQPRRLRPTLSPAALAWKAGEAGWYVLRDLEVKAGPLADSYKAAGWLLAAQGQSCDWACKHEGWAVLEIGPAVEARRRALAVQSLAEVEAMLRFARSTGPAAEALDRMLDETGGPA